MKPLRASLLRILSWVLLAGVAVQLYFIARIGLMASTGDGGGGTGGAARAGRAG